MTFEYRIHSELGLTCIRVSGLITADVEEKMMLEIIADPAFARDMKILVDRRESSMELALADVKKFIAGLTAHEEVFGHPRIAVVTGQDVDFGLHRQFQALADGVVKHDYRVFRSLDQAKQFLELEIADEDLI
jgi:hypothetical protein